MVELKDYKGPIISILLIIGVLMVMIAIGFTIGILSEDPDGLEATIINVRGEDWLEGLHSPWNPILSWIDNDYLAGVIGVLLSFVLIMGIFYIIVVINKKRT